MKVGQSTFRQLGFDHNMAHSYMRKLWAVGCIQYNSKVVRLKRTSHGSYSDTLYFEYRADIDEAMSCLRQWLIKPLYSKKCNPSKWEELLLLLKAIKEKHEVHTDNNLHKNNF